MQAPVGRRVRLAHIFSSDLGIRGTLPYVAPLRDRNWEITFLTPEGPDVSKAAAHGYRWLPLTFTRRINLAGDVSATAALMRTLARERFNIVHTHNFKVSLVGRVLAYAVQTPIVVHTIHGITWSLDTPEPNRTVNALLERAASLRADLVLSQSATDRDSFVAMNVVPPEKIRVIGNGIDLTRFDPALVLPESRQALRREMGVTEGETLVVFAGRMVREKGIEEVFAAARSLAGSGVRMAFAGRDDRERGDAPSSGALDDARAGRVIFLGERTDMPAVYAAADIVGLASWREGIPRSLMEGAAMARPLLATDIRGCRDVVRDGETGVLVPVRDPAALAAALRALAQAPEERQAMGRAARQDALDRFDIRAIVAKVCDAYDELLARKRLS